LGAPVLPVVNFQIPTSSTVVGAASRVSGAASASVRNGRSPGSSSASGTPVTSNPVAPAARNAGSVTASASTTTASV
jgi:hypothetical protein